MCPELFDVIFCPAFHGLSRLSHRCFLGLWSLMISMRNLGAIGIRQSAWWVMDALTGRWWANYILIGWCHQWYNSDTMGQWLVITSMTTGWQPFFNIMKPLPHSLMFNLSWLSVFSVRFASRCHSQYWRTSFFFRNVPIWDEFVDDLVVWSHII